MGTRPRSMGKNTIKLNKTSRNIISQVILYAMATERQSVYWSVIVPCYNESKRVHNISYILQYLKKLDQTWELVVVDDGRTDDTLEKLKDLKKKSNFKLINYKNNRGKGYAVKTGMLAAVGKFRLFLDVDLSTPVEEMKEFGKFTDKYDVIVGTRKVKGSRVKVRQPIIREYLGKCFTLLSQIILNT